jgi:hypothetical protein
MLSLTVLMISFLLADINNLFTLAKRINSSWINGTPLLALGGLQILSVLLKLLGYPRYGLQSQSTLKWW